MKDNSNLLVFLGLLAGAGVAYAIFGKKEKSDPKTEIPSSRKAVEGSTTTVGQALTIANNIENAIGYLSADWQKIARQFQICQNGQDVVNLYNAFGQRDCAGLANGDLFQVLAAAYDQFQYQPFIKPALDSIKAHCYEYHTNIIW